MTQPPPGGYPPQGNPGQYDQQPGPYGQQPGSHPQHGQPQHGQPQQGQQQYGQPQQGQPQYGQQQYGQQPQSQPAYQPPQGGYPQPGQPPHGYGQPGQGQQYPYAGPGYGGPTTSKAATHWSAYAAIAAGVVTFLAGFLPFYAASVDYSGVSDQYKPYIAGAGPTSQSANAWSLWWWIPVVLALVVAALVALVAFNVLSAKQVPPTIVFYGSVVVAVAMIGVVIHALVGPKVCDGGTCYDVKALQSQLDTIGGKLSIGPGWGLWVTLVAALALAYFTFAWSRQSRSVPSAQQGYPQQGHQQPWG